MQLWHTSTTLQNANKMGWLQNSYNNYYCINVYFKVTFSLPLPSSLLKHLLLTWSRKYVVKLQRGSVLFSLNDLTWSSNLPRWRLNDNNSRRRSFTTKFCQDSIVRGDLFSLKGSHNWIILRMPQEGTTVFSGVYNDPLESYT